MLLLLLGILGAGAFAIEEIFWDHLPWGYRTALMGGRPLAVFASACIHGGILAVALLPAGILWGARRHLRARICLCLLFILLLLLGHPPL